MLVKRSALLCAALWTLAGCYRATPIQGVTTDVGAPVRLQLTDQASCELSPLIGSGITRADGRLVSASDSALTLSLTNVVARNGIETSWKGEQVSFRRSGLVRIERRELDRRRSWMVGVGGVAATVALGAAFNLLGGTFGGKNGPVGGGPR
jgi:hypothetical protein